jgi:hypothetical protein
MKLVDDMASGRGARRKRTSVRRPARCCQRSRRIGGGAEAEIRRTHRARRAAIHHSAVRGSD